MKKIVFFGTPDVCLPYLDALAGTVYQPELIICNPDRPIGRKQIITPPPTKEWAHKHEIPVLQPEKLDESVFQQLSALRPDLFIVIAYGKILPERFISLPRHGTINVHYSLLPRWRGACPVESAILHGDTDIAMTIQQMRYQLDRGPIIASKTRMLDGTEYTDTLRQELSYTGANLLVETLPAIFDQTITPIEQDETKATHCGKIKKEDAELLSSDDDLTKWRKFRAYHLWPVAWYRDSSGKRVKVTGARYENDTFTITKYIREGEPETVLE